MKIKTAEASGKILDGLVAMCLGVNLEAFRLYYEPTEPDDYDKHGYPEFHYSTVWGQAGPIIERGGITVEATRDEFWSAYICYNGKRAGAMGPTPLIAAMRCFVAWKLGDEVELPKELQ
jgi:hypothetical protein